MFNARLFQIYDIFCENISTEIEDIISHCIVQKALERASMSYVTIRRNLDKLLNRKTRTLLCSFKYSSQNLMDVASNKIQHFDAIVKGFQPWRVLKPLQMRKFTKLTDYTRTYSLKQISLGKQFRIHTEWQVKLLYIPFQFKCIMQKCRQVAIIFKTIKISCAFLCSRFIHSL